MNILCQCDEKIKHLEEWNESQGKMITLLQNRYRYLLGKFKTKKRKPKTESQAKLRGKSYTPDENTKPWQTIEGQGW